MRNLIAFTLFIFLGQASVLAQPQQDLNVVEVINQDALSSLGDTFGEDNPLYNEIIRYFEQHEENIRRRQLERIDWDGNRRVWGGLNHVGLAYSKDFATFSIELKRDVAPDLFDDERWIVTDTFNIYIDASTVFNKLIDLGAISVTPAQLAAVAGLTFKRSYRFAHFAASYREAITMNLNRFFFSFLNFRSQNFLQLKPGEFISKEDFLGVHAGALGSLPVSDFLVAHLGVLAKFQLLGKVEIHSPLPSERTNDQDYLRFNYERSKTATLGVSAGISADFLQLLRLTILKYDFSYSMEESYKNHLTFSQEQVTNDLVREHPVAQEVAKVLRHQSPNLDVLAPYVVSEERRKTEKASTKYNFLFWGTIRDEVTSHVQITRNNRVKTFFKHNFSYERTKVNPADWLLESFLRSHAVTTLFVKRKTEASKSLRIEYDSERNLLKSHSDLYLSHDGHEKISVHFIRDHRAKVSSSNRQQMRDTFAMLENYGGADPQMIRNLRRTPLRNNLYGNIHATIHENGLRHFNSLKDEEIIPIIDNLCASSGSGSYYKVCRWYLKKSFRSYLKEKSSYKITQEDIIFCDNLVAQARVTHPHVGEAGLRDYHHRCLLYRAEKGQELAASELPLWKLKEVMQDILLYSTSKVAYYDLFGLKNVHLHGQIKSTDKDFKEINHYFREGFFQGIGVISNYRRQGGQ